MDHFYLPWNNKRKSRSKGGGVGVTPKYKSSVEYFQKELDKDQIQALYQVYKMDFELYGYSANEYLDSLP